MGKRQSTFAVLQTYKDAILEPGPRLNLVLGPNGEYRLCCSPSHVSLSQYISHANVLELVAGTGKSSFVCALCLGLAGSTTVSSFCYMHGSVIQLNVFCCSYWEEQIL